MQVIEDEREWLKRDIDFCSTAHLVASECDQQSHTPFLLLDSIRIDFSSYWVLCNLRRWATECAFLIFWRWVFEIGGCIFFESVFVVSRLCKFCSLSEILGCEKRVYIFIVKYDAALFTGFALMASAYGFDICCILPWPCVCVYLQRYSCFAVVVKLETSEEKICAGILIIYLLKS